MEAANIWNILIQNEIIRIEAEIKKINEKIDLTLNMHCKSQSDYERMEGYYSQEIEEIVDLEEKIASLKGEIK